MKPNLHRSSARFLPTRQIRQWAGWWATESSSAAVSASLVVEYPDGGEPTVYEITIQPLWRNFPNRMRAGDLEVRLREFINMSHPTVSRASMVLYRSPRPDCERPICGVLWLIDRS